MIIVAAFTLRFYSEISNTARTLSSTVFVHNGTKSAASRHVNITPILNHDQRFCLWSGWKSKPAELCVQSYRLCFTDPAAVLLFWVKSIRSCSTGSRSERSPFRLQAFLLDFSQQIIIKNDLVWFLTGLWGIAVPEVCGWWFLFHTSAL